MRTQEVPGGSAFTHDGFGYRDADGFVAGLVPFVRAGIAADELVFAMLPPDRVDMLREALDDDAHEVRFLDGTVPNPARIIPTVRALLDQQPPGRGVRGIGETVTIAQAPDTVAEALLHDALINVAFERDSVLWMRCPYDETGLPEDVRIALARSHPTLVTDGGDVPSATFGGIGHAASAFGGALPEPPPGTVTDLVHFGLGDLPDIRDLVTIRASSFGLRRDRALDLTLAANEIVTNSLCHGGERGTMRLWRVDATLVCEVTDAGHIEEPLVGRVVPVPAVPGGRGVWLANQLCDLVQIRSSPDTGTVVRLHMLRDG